MANGSTTLARIQGQGLVETAPVGMTGIQGAGMTPAGAAAKGMTPDAAKMAGTPPAKVNAIRVAMQDVGSKRLGALREVAQADLKEDARVKVAQQASVMGRLDETMATYINKQLQDSFNASILNKANEFASIKPTVKDAAKVQTSVANILAGKGTDEDIANVNTAIKDSGATGQVSLTKDTSPLTNATLIANTLFTNLTGEQMVEQFGKAVAEANKNTDISDFLASADAETFAKAEGLAAEGDTDPAAALQSIISSIVPEGSDLTKMKLGDLTDAIQTWKQQNFKDVSEYQKTLQDPNASRAQQQMALENLRNLGKVGVIAADAKIGDLDAQMRDGDQVTIDGQQFEISEFFTEPEKLSELKGWLDRPETAPDSLKRWIEGNRDAIENKIKDLNPDLEQLSNTVQSNMEAVKLPDNVQLPKETADFFFGESLLKPTIAAKSVPEKYELLKDPANGPVMANLLGRLKTIGNGLDGRKMFDALSVDQLKTIISTNGVERYINNAIMQKQVKDFSEKNIDETNFAGSFRLLLGENLGMDDAGASLARLANKDLSAYTDIFKNAGLLNPPNNILVNGRLNISLLKDKLKEFANRDANSLISGDGFTALKDYLNNKIMGNIRNSLSRIPTAAEPPQSKGAEMPIEFHKDGPYKQTPDQRRKSLEWDLSPLSGLSYNIARLEKELKAHNENEPRNWLGGKDKGWTEWKQKQERLQAELNPHIAKRDETRRELEDLPNWTLRRQSAYESWREKELATRDQKNEQYRQTYTTFTNILGGLV